VALDSAAFEAVPTLVQSLIFLMIWLSNFE
jgi:hypothetical protein